MNDRVLSPLVEGGSFFECPRWRDGRWWVSNFYREAVYTVSVDGTEDRVLTVEHQPIRVAPGGAIVDEVHTPEGQGCFACALGGDDGRTLLICAAPDFLETARRPARDAVLLTATVEVAHAGLP